MPLRVFFSGEELWLSFQDFSRLNTRKTSTPPIGKSPRPSSTASTSLGQWWDDCSSIFFCFRLTSSALVFFISYFLGCPGHDYVRGRRIRVLERVSLLLSSSLLTLLPIFFLFFLPSPSCSSLLPVFHPLAVSLLRLALWRLSSSGASFSRV